MYRIAIALIVILCNLWNVKCVQFNAGRFIVNVLNLKCFLPDVEYMLRYLENKELFVQNIYTGFNKPIEPSESDFPHQTALLAQVNGTELIFCGGSLIHPRWVLTAAHCLEQDGKQFPTSLLKVAVGSIYSDLRGGQKLDVKETIIHKAYFESSASHDIGLIKLKRFVKLSSLVNSIRLHTNTSENLLGQTVYLTGLGFINDFSRKPERLRKAILHVNTPDKCFIDPTKDATQLCCTSTLFEGKACKGDSGGPLVIQRNGQKYQIGITSHLAFLPICKFTFNHSVYTKVTAYIKWISANTGIDFYKYKKTNTDNLNLTTQI